MVWWSVKCPLSSQLELALGLQVYQLLRFAVVPELLQEYQPLQLMVVQHPGLLAFQREHGLDGAEAGGRREVL